MEAASWQSKLATGEWSRKHEHELMQQWAFDPTQAPEQTRVKSSVDYSLFWNNCSHVLAKLFPDQYDCSAGPGAVWLPSACKRVRNEARSAPFLRLKTTEVRIKNAWRRHVAALQKGNSLFGCNFSTVLERALQDRKKLRVAVGYVQHQRYSFLQHLSLFFYFAEEPGHVCSLGVNLQRPLAMLPLPMVDRKQRFASPDKVLLKQFRPDDLHLVDDFELGAEDLERLVSVLRIAKVRKVEYYNLFDKDKELFEEGVDKKERWRGLPGRLTALWHKGHA
jgi:hypothetical protein